MAVAELSASVPGQRKRAQPGSGFSWAPPLPDPRGSSGARTASHSCSDWRHGGGLTSDSHWLWAAPGRREKPPPPARTPPSPEKGAPMSRRHSPEKRQVGAVGSRYRKQADDGCPGPEKRAGGGGGAQPHHSFYFVPFLIF